MNTGCVLTPPSLHRLLRKDDQRPRIMDLPQGPSPESPVAHVQIQVTHVNAFRVGLVVISSPRRETSPRFCSSLQRSDKTVVSTDTFRLQVSTLALRNPTQTFPGVGSQSV